MSDIDTAVVDGLKALDPEWPIREADISGRQIDAPDPISEGPSRWAVIPFESQGMT